MSEVSSLAKVTVKHAEGALVTTYDSELLEWLTTIHTWVADKEINFIQADVATTLYSDLAHHFRQHDKNLFLPVIQYLQNGILMLSWSPMRHFFSIDIHKSGEFEWFCRDREAGTLAGSPDDHLTTTFPLEALEYLGQMDIFKAGR